MNLEPRVKLGLLALLAMSCSSTPPAPEAESKPKTLLKEVPQEIRKDVSKRLSVFSDRVDKLEREQLVVVEIKDPQERLDKLNELRDNFGECADGIYDVLHDEKYKPYQGEEYGPFWGSQERRLVYYQAKMNSLKKLADQAAIEVKAKKESVK